MATNTIAAPGKGTRLKTPRFRVSFPQVFEKASYNNGTPRYAVTGLFYPLQFTEAEKAQWQAIKAKLGEVCLEFFKKDIKTMKADRTFKIPFHKGDEKDYQGYGDPNMVYFTMANSKRKPGILDIKGNPITADNSEEFYAGCWARASVNPYAFNNIGKGLAIGLGNLQKVKDDDSFEGFTSAEEDFGNDPVEGFDDTDEFDGVGDDDDPTA
jgi:Protein of unknown function (DUF2815)